MKSIKHSFYLTVHFYILLFSIYFSVFVLIDKILYELNPIQIQIELKYIYKKKKKILKHSDIFEWKTLQHKVNIERLFIFLLNSEIIMKHQNSDHHKMECYSILKLRFDHKAVTTKNNQKKRTFNILFHVVHCSEFMLRFVI